MNTYTRLGDIGIVVCNDCGAQAKTEQEVKHFDNCVPGESQKWEKLLSEKCPHGVPYTMPCEACDEEYLMSEEE